MKIKQIKYSGLAIFLLGIMTTIVMFSCKREFAPINPDAVQVAEFVAPGLNVFGVNNVDAVPTYNIPVGITAKRDKDVTVSISISSPTGAQNGQQYTVQNSNIVIKAGTVLDSLTITSDFAQYEDGRVDTLILTINSVSDGIGILGEGQTMTLVIKKFCTIVIDDFLGNAVIDDPNFWGEIDPAVITKVDDKTIHVSGIFGESTYGFNVVINSDGSATVTKQVVGSTLPGTPYTNPAVSGSGTYDACAQVLSLSFTYSVAQGSFSGVYDLTIHR